MGPRVGPRAGRGGGRVAPFTVALVTLVACGGDDAAPAPPDGSPMDAATDGAPGDTGAPDGSFTDGGPATDRALDSGPPPQEGCMADADLGTQTGIDVVVESTLGSHDLLFPECAPSPSSSPERIYRWRAPAAGLWLFDTLGSTFDTALYIRDLECRVLACSDNGTADLLSRAIVELDADQEVYVAVDGAAGDAGDFRLSIHEALLAEGNCGDGIDDDRDGQVDCEDLSDCSNVAPCIETACGDGSDNDLDGFADCQDSNCADVEPCAETQCGDGVDGDMDLNTDCADRDCDDREPCGEAICDDGLDGDMNGLTDCDDVRCECASNCLPPDPCPEVDLGSALGPSVAFGETGGCPRRTPRLDACPGALVGSSGAGPEKTFLWTAPEAGVYSFDTSGSSFDTLLYLLDGCDGPIIACNEDIVRGILTRSRITREFAAGETVVAVIDSGSGGGSGGFALNILQSQ